MPRIIVESPHGATPFSRGRIVKSLCLMGINLDQAYVIANSVKSVLDDHEQSTVSVQYIDDLIEQLLLTMSEHDFYQRFHFWRQLLRGLRGKLTEQKRNSTVYLQHLKEIRTIQSFIVKQAHQYHVPVIENDSLEITVNQIIAFIQQQFF